MFFTLYLLHDGNMVRKEPSPFKGLKFIKWGHLLVGSLLHLHCILQY